MDLNFWQLCFLISLICLRYAIVLTIILAILAFIFRKSGFFKLLMALTIFCAKPARAGDSKGYFHKPA